MAQIDRTELTLRQSVYRTKEFCKQRLGNWVLEKPEGKIGHAQQEPKAISPGRGITDAATNDAAIGRLGV